MERLRQENAALKREVGALRASDATRSDWLGGLMRTKKKESAAEAAAEGTSPRSRARALAAQQQQQPAGRASPSPSPVKGHVGAALKLYPPLSAFWDDVPTSNLSLLKSGSEVRAGACGCCYEYYWWWWGVLLLRPPRLRSRRRGTATPALLLLLILILLLPLLTNSTHFPLRFT